MRRDIILGTVGLFSACALVACLRDPPDCLVGQGPADACRSGGLPGESSMSEAEKYYLANVDPGFAQRCATCHGTGQMAAPAFLVSGNPTGSYTKLVAYGGLAVGPSNSGLLLHGEHTGPALEPTQVTAVTTWLCMEIGDRGLPSDPRCSGGDVGSTMTVYQALEEFGNCMSYEDWVATGMSGLAWALAGDKRCNGCHNTGDGGAFLSANDMTTFSMNRQMPFVKKLVSGTVNEDGYFEDLVPARRFIEKGSESCPNNTGCHLPFILPPELEKAVTDFVDITLKKWHEGTCTVDGSSAQP